MTKLITKSTIALGAMALAITLITGLLRGEAVAETKAQETVALAALANGHLYEAEPQALYLSEDGGNNWQQLALPEVVQSGRITAVDASAIAEDTLYLAGRGFGVLVSRDAGRSWQNLSGNLPSAEVVALSAHSTQSDTLYAVVAEEGVYRTQDAGASWRLMHKGPGVAITDLVHSNMEGSMETGWLFAATEEGVYRTMDCFCLFELAGDLPAAAEAVTFDRKKPAEVYAAVGQQIFRTKNGGQEWESIGEFSTEVMALAHSTGVIFTQLADGRLGQSTDGKNWK